MILSMSNEHMKHSQSWLYYTQEQGGGGEGRVQVYLSKGLIMIIFNPLYTDVGWINILCRTPVILDFLCLV